MEGTCGRGVRGWMTKRCLLPFMPLPSREYAMIFLITSFQLSKNTGIFRPELRYSKARKTVSGPKIQKDLLF